MFTEFDRTRLVLKPLSERVHDMDLNTILNLDDPIDEFKHPDLPKLADRIIAVRDRDGEVILMMGAHVIKQGCSRFVIELMERGILTHIALNGAGVIHDFELALIGASTESVAKYISEGQFGLWQEASRINDLIRQGADRGLGLGEAVGQAIEEEQFPYRDVSILATGYRLKVPVTVHVGIGYDIIHEHPNCDGAALGSTSYRDFLIFAHTVEGLEGGVLLNFGTAVMGPEVYLKALAMARNVARQEGREICRFTTAVFDMFPIERNYHQEVKKTEPGYYFRPWKTILVRTVKDSYYFRGDHRSTFPTLVRKLIEGK